ncbi:uncharacterized protein LOC106160102 [Lingula anatina]|uniref:Uncharacterized protein LOC106160102 n=1 Tax=Lingula anatina TaxID=7574 RepID=A0A1S3I3Y6_LINAN|nr:uncharacterized protein LOC106160102 [Lingula anatina]XP_013392070.1 uncharacterized protein LOC106160102 [Lingula anatina]|eukprot:XP_013392069.1 uncharacterized protein LOC106160102 [Lingula anatina]
MDLQSTWPDYDTTEPTTTPTPEEFPPIAIAAIVVAGIFGFLVLSAMVQAAKCALDKRVSSRSHVTPEAYISKRETAAVNGENTSQSYDVSATPFSEQTSEHLVSPLSSELGVSVTPQGPNSPPSPQAVEQETFRDSVFTSSKPMEMS